MATSRKDMDDHQSDGDLEEDENNGKAFSNISYYVDYY